jgi:hypothetical protein
LSLPFAAGSKYTLILSLFYWQTRETIPRHKHLKKWSETKRKSELKNNRKTQFLALYNAKTCFSLEAITENPSSQNEKYWHWTLKTSNKSFKGEMTSFQGHETQTTSVYSSDSYTSSTITTSKYTLFSIVCFPAKIDFARPFSVMLEARYEKKEKVVNFSWGEVEEE